LAAYRVDQSSWAAESAAGHTFGRPAACESVLCAELRRCRRSSGYLPRAQYSHSLFLVDAFVGHCRAHVAPSVFQRTVRPIGWLVVAGGCAYLGAASVAIGSDRIY